mmetsp:Transcript_8531/g.20636  ORF Transcript_8531/g.20636 Transcript_8531/m.20636 type:complete len:300 (-) Transcript_8531:2499-3398(-)
MSSIRAAEDCFFLAILFSPATIAFIPVLPVSAPPLPPPLSSATTAPTLRGSGGHLPGFSFILKSALLLREPPAPANSDDAFLSAPFFRSMARSFQCKNLAQFSSSTLRSSVPQFFTSSKWSRTSRMFEFFAKICAAAWSARSFCSITCSFRDDSFFSSSAFCSWKAFCSFSARKSSMAGLEADAEEPLLPACRCWGAATSCPANNPTLDGAAVCTFKISRASCALRVRSFLRFSCARLIFAFRNVASSFVSHQGCDATWLLPLGTVETEAEAAAPGPAAPAATSLLLPPNPGKEDDPDS